MPSKHALKQALFAARLVAGAAADGVAAEDAAGVKLRMARRFRALRALRVESGGFASFVSFLNVATLQVLFGPC